MQEYDFLTRAFVTCNYKLFVHDGPYYIACCRITAKRIRFFPKLTDLSGQGKSVEPKQTTREKTLFTIIGLIDTLGNHKLAIGKTAS